MSKNQRNYVPISDFAKTSKACNFILFSLKNANGRRKSTIQNDFRPSLIFGFFKLFFDLVLPTEMILVMKCGLGGKI